MTQASDRLAAHLPNPRCLLTNRRMDRSFPVWHGNIYNRPVSLSDSFNSTKIMATLGPATRRTDVIVRLIEEGASLFRLNFSHGTFEDLTQCWPRYARPLNRPKYRLL